MTVEVVGESVQDVLHKLGRTQGYQSSWLNIEPYTQDYGRRPTGQFMVRWTKGDESFKQIVNSQAELMQLITPLISAYTKWYKGIEAAEKKKQREDAKALVKAAAKKLVEAEKRLQEIE